MIFAWDETNLLHIAKHKVSPEEAQEVVAGAKPPFPHEVGNEKLVVWGQTGSGRYLQVIFVLKPPQLVEYESVLLEDWLEIESEGIGEIVRIIHAMDLTPDMKKRLRKRRR
jgi:uncharacterized DUF497 family protein